MQQQQKNIRKTVVVIVAIMATFLALFFHKITTPRYLSDIELKINGLTLLKQPVSSASVLANSQSSITTNDRWIVVANNVADKKILEMLHASLKRSLQDKLTIVEQPNTKAQKVSIIKPDNLYIGYFTPPYDLNKMKLTLSSLLTHR